MTHHRLYRQLLEYVYEQKSLAEAELNLKVLHEVLLCSIRHRKGEDYTPIEDEIYDEFRAFLRWDGKLTDE
jgi:hypothetical protein